MCVLFVYVIKPITSLITSREDSAILVRHLNTAETHLFLRLNPKRRSISRGRRSVCNVARCVVSKCGDEDAILDSA